MRHAFRQENDYTSPEFSIARLERVLITGFVSVFQTRLTDISLASHFGPWANSADRDQTPQNAEIITKIGHGPVQLIRMDGSTRQMWVKHYLTGV